MYGIRHFLGRGVFVCLVALLVSAISCPLVAKAANISDQYKIQQDYDLSSDAIPGEPFNDSASFEIVSDNIGRDAVSNSELSLGLPQDDADRAPLNSLEDNYDAADSSRGDEKHLDSTGTGIDGESNESIIGELDSAGQEAQVGASSLDKRSDIEGQEAIVDKSDTLTVQILRLYNPNSGEHLYTNDLNEYSVLSSIGWVTEGGAWISPSLSNNPVFRLYNPFSGDHHYTLSDNEYQSLSGLGWVREGIAWYGDDDGSVKLFRFFNPNVSVGTHHYTSSAEERMRMVSDGWVYEGLAWFGVDMGATAPEWTQPGWVESNGACFYANSDSTYAHGWQTIDNQKYYFDREGRKSVGATDVDGTIYDFGDDGCLKHGWRDHSGYRYYFDPASGALSKAGWLQLGNNWYYLNTTSGAMATGLRRIDGLLRYFGNDGVCDKVGYQVNWGGLRLSINSATLPSYTSGSFWNYVTPSRIAVDSNRSACIESFISAAYDYMNAVTRWVDNQCSRPGDTVDCSGLVMECLYACGMSLDGTAAGDFNPYSKYYWNHSFANTWRNNQIFQPVSLNDVERGDIIYYYGHVAIYLGGGQIIESTSLSSNVRVGSMYNPGRPIGAARPFTK